MSIYRVSGQYRYRDHDVGETFEAYLEPDAEARALTLGTIEIIDRRQVGLRPGSYRLPAGWRIVTHDGAPSGASPTERGNLA